MSSVSFISTPAKDATEQAASGTATPPETVLQKRREEHQSSLQMAAGFAWLGRESNLQPLQPQLLSEGLVSAKLSESPCGVSLPPGPFLWIFPGVGGRWGNLDPRN